MKKSARKKKFFTNETNIEKPSVTTLQSEEKKGPMKKILSNKPLFIGSVVILTIIITAGVIYGVSYFAPNATNSDPLGNNEAQELLKVLEDIAVLPKGEVPTVATVTEVEKLAGQPFFSKAENGDKVVVFGVAKTAILYRPSVKKIISMTTIDQNAVANASESASNTQVNTIQATPSEKPKVKVAVLNSTKEVGLAKKGGDLLDEDKFDVIATQNAIGEYEKTTITIVNKDAVANTDLNLITGAMSDIDATTASLPADEGVPAGADVVVILGSDFSDAY